METIKVGLVEDQKLFREGIKVLINSYEGLHVTFESPDGFSVLDRLQQLDQIPEVMLIDLSLPPKNGEEFGGWRVLKVLNDQYPEMKKLILSVNNDPFVIAKIIEEGAHGYLAKDVDPEEVVEGIKSVFSNGSYINELSLSAIQRKMSGNLQEPIIHGELTTREIDVLKLVCQGKITKEIAEELFISEKTVNGHRNNILQKTGARNAAGLVMYAVKNGLVEIN